MATPMIARKETIINAIEALECTECPTRFIPSLEARRLWDENKRGRLQMLRLLLKRAKR